MTLKLISFELCPYVQRSIITLLEKAMSYEISYLSFDELKKSPPWLTKISPFGKVPVLTVDGTTVFESMVIMEYINEIKQPSLHPTDPLQRAVNRAWIKFGDELLSSLSTYAHASNESNFLNGQQEIEKGLLRLESIISEGPFFNGQDFALIDASYAPLFMRLDILEGQHHSGFYDNKPRVSHWAEGCRNRQTVKDSVVVDFAEKYIHFVCGMSDHSAHIFGSST